MLKPLILRLHSARYLKPVQIYRLLRNRLLGFPRPVRNLSPAPSLRPLAGPFVSPIEKPVSMLGPLRFRFLNLEFNIDGPATHPLTHSFTQSQTSSTYEGRSQPSLLWLYNLHYHDDLTAAGVAERREWHEAWIARWIRENPPGASPAWDPYPTALRIVNWIKRYLSGSRLSTVALHSLAIQARQLAANVEHMLQGNHLLTDGKGLAFAGCFFKGPEAHSWLSEGLRILRRQVPEQILPDGGHFERSPMYQGIIAEDLLDLVNLFDAYGFGGPERDMIASRVPGMLSWLDAMTHPDGEIAFFNDAALGIAPALKELQAYAERLGIERGTGEIPNLNEERSISVAKADPHGAPASGRPRVPAGRRRSKSDPEHGIRELRESGFVRMECGPAVVIADVGSVGPNCQPGHAHAGTLSFELSLDEKKILVNSGISLYGEGPDRLQQRGTAAHNTVVIDGQDSSEVWGGFRVAQKARSFDLRTENAEGELRVSCSHDGYRRLPGKPVHRRTWVLRPCSLRVIDRIEGEFYSAEAFFHFNPGAGEVAIEAGGCGVHAGPYRVRWEGGHGEIAEETYHPEFGLSQPSKTLRLRFRGKALKTVFDYRM